MIAVPEPGQGLTKTLQAVVTVILPRYPDLDPGVRAAVEQDVARYVARQIGSMPSFLRIPYRLALLAFDWLAAAVLRSPVPRPARGAQRSLPGVVERRADPRHARLRAADPQLGAAGVLRSSGGRATARRATIGERAPRGARLTRGLSTMCPAETRSDTVPPRTQVLVIGSGAGGAATAATLGGARLRGRGPRRRPESSTPARSRRTRPRRSRRLYRNGGVTPILGDADHRLRRGPLRRRLDRGQQRLLAPPAAGLATIAGAPTRCSPTSRPRSWSRTSSSSSATLSVSYLNAASAAQLGGLPPRHRGDGLAVRRGAALPEANPTAAARSRPGSKQSMQRTYIPKALAAGARLVPDCKARRLLHENGRVTGVLVQHCRNARADRAFESTPTRSSSAAAPCRRAALLRRSGITRNVGDNLCIHPMIKAAALFDEEIERAPGRPADLPGEGVLAEHHHRRLGVHARVSRHAAVGQLEGEPARHARLEPHGAVLRRHARHESRHASASCPVSTTASSFATASPRPIGRTSAMGWRTSARFSSPPARRRSIPRCARSRCCARPSSAAASSSSRSRSPRWACRPCTPSAAARWARIPTSAPPIRSAR